MSGQDVMALVPGRPLHEALARVDHLQRIGEAVVDMGRALHNRRAPTTILPGACVLRGSFPDGSLVRESDAAGLGNL